MLSETSRNGSAVVSDLSRGGAARDYAGICHGYARGVVSGEIIACRWIRLACERHLQDLERSLDPASVYVFDATAAGNVCTFVEALPHVKGKWGRGQLLTLEPWQVWILASVFGWLHRSSGLRRYSEVYVCVPRKNGKSALSAGVLLYGLAADGEYGAEVYTGATCKRQAMFVFGPAKAMAQRSPRVRELFGIRVGSNNLSVASTASRAEPLIGDPGDGASPSLVVIDEYHEHATNRLYDAMVTGMGAREQPVCWIITTAGVDTAGPCRAYQSECERVLEGHIEREELFCAIYTIDKEDDWASLEAAKKANPNWGVSVYPHVVAKNLRKAVQSAREQNTYKTKHLNIWVGADVAWLNMVRWRELANRALRPAQLLGVPCFGGSDFSSKLDLAGTVRVFRRIHAGKDHYYVFVRAYLPEGRAKLPECQHYAAWALEGHLTLTPGNVIDFDVIQADAIADARACGIKEWGFDPWNAEVFAQTLAKKVPGLVAVEVPQQTRHLSEPMKMLEALVVDGRIHHDGHPILEWCLGNIVAHLDHKQNIFPNQAKDESKIDLGIALINAMSRALVGARKVSVYSTRGLRKL